MRGFHRIMKLTMWNTYSNARKIADDIIISLINNHGLDDCDITDMPTYTSTIKRSISDLLGDIDAEDDYHMWIIKIYSCDGNYESRLSISQNPKLLNEVDTDNVKPSDSFQGELMKLYHLNSSLKVLSNRYRMSKRMTDADNLKKMRSDIKDHMDNMVKHIEVMDCTYREQMKHIEAEINNIISQIVDVMHDIELDDMPLNSEVN